MNEDKILNKALVILDELGIEESLKYLEENKNSDVSSQYYNYLYCLGSLSARSEIGLNYLEEAIIENNMWYRPEVFEDEDLDSIRNELRFKELLEISNTRYLEALKNTKTELTWATKTNDSLVLALHGNQQNMNDSISSWNFLKNHDYQVEYIQSSELDSCGIYRWSDDGDGYKQLINAINKIDLSTYQYQILCGFSAGCNVILKALLNDEITASKIILQSPWIPVIEEKLDEVVSVLIKKEIEVYIICGTEDEDCYPQSIELYQKLNEIDGHVVGEWINNLNHEFSDNHEEIVLKFLKGH